MRLVLDSVAGCAAAWQRERSDEASERERASAIASPSRRAQFLGGRWLVAQLLAQEGGGLPSQWHLSCEPGEAPSVLDGPGVGRPFLSIAHRDDVLACAVADSPVGLDLELTGRLRASPSDLAALMLSPQERTAFDLVSAPQREAFLLLRWTLKEAWAKRSGRGLALGQMCSLDTSASDEGGNARAWVAPGVVVAWCFEGAHGTPLPRGMGLDHAAAQHWHVGPTPSAD
jgi:4'-phosphopantetheinyl transferase